jgi:excisionase family DNA binding protein
MSTTVGAAAYLSVVELAAHLGISKHTAYALVRSGAVPSVKLGGLYRIPRVELDRQLAEQTRK